MTELAETWEGVSQWIKPIWMALWSLVHLTVGVLLLLLWAATEAIVQRQRLASGIRGAVSRVRDAELS